MTSLWTSAEHAVKTICDRFPKIGLLLEEFSGEGDPVELYLRFGKVVSAEEP